MTTSLLPTTPDARFRSSAIRELLHHARRPEVISLAGGLPAAELLPHERVAAAAASVLEQGPDALQYGLTEGEPELRSAIAANAQRPIDDIIVTAGSQQALDLTLAVLGRRDVGDPVAAVENPAYLGAIQALRAREYRMEPIPVDDEGLAVDVLGDRLRAGLRPRVCYTNPNFQNPTGATLAPERAIELVELAERYGFVVIADDPYVDLHLDGPRPTPLPCSPSVVRLGSMSKTLSPGMRVGWLEGPPDLVQQLSVAKQPADLQTSTLNQLIAAEILTDSDWWTPHLDRLRSTYRLRRQALLSAVRSVLPNVHVSPQGGGFFLWLTLSGPGPSPTELLDTALDAGLAFVPGEAFAVGEPRGRTLRLSYSSGDPADFGEAVQRMSALLEIS